MSALSLSTRLALFWSLLLLPSCIDPYMPDVISSTKNYLVVDGFINSDGITTINLSRTYAISSAAAPPKEAKATVYIEDETGMRYTLRENSQGTYVSNSLHLNTATKYRLHILTTAGKEYSSGYAPVKTTPAIDNLNWQAASTGLTIYVNSHDDTNKTQYYRWEYEETWEIVPPYFPVVEYKNGMMRSKTSDFFPKLCWGTTKSVDIKQASTIRLTRDIVSNYVIRSFPATADQLNRRYSILVRQYAQTMEEYMYRELLRKNTENIGTLFDPLPAQLTGNIRCLNDEQELALGYVGVNSMVEKRIFIQRSELPSTWNVLTGYESCLPPDIVELYPAVSQPPSPAEILQAAFSNPNYLPIDVINDADHQPVAYMAKSRECIDCRLRGTAVKPSFWL